MHTFRQSNVFSTPTSKLVLRHAVLKFATAIVLVGLVLPNTPLGPAEAMAGCEVNRCNCVLYARCRVPKLPFKLDTTAQKQAIVNAQAPLVGSVAIFTYNHVAVVTRVENVNGKTVVTIDEANYVGCTITTRRGTPGDLKIFGYFRP